MATSIPVVNAAGSVVGSLALNADGSLPAASATSIVLAPATGGGGGGPVTFSVTDSTGATVGSLTTSPNGSISIEGPGGAVLGFVSLVSGNVQLK